MNTSSVRVQTQQAEANSCQGLGFLVLCYCGSDTQKATSVASGGSPRTAGDRGNFCPWDPGGSGKGPKKFQEKSSGKWQIL
ncbi:rCG22944 [Rattus norvegicus]|uniref:RCG22944 n=1 Tax=Rattus norvegicus TaxID=10116 RepID=A6KB21_RAT|nr:rCG22944 [Rattus norvegicus]